MILPDHAEQGGSAPMASPTRPSPKLRIAFVTYDVNEGRVFGRYPPLHLCVLATNLARAGYEVRVFDYTGTLTRIDEYFREIRDFRPGMVGMACFTPYVASLHRVSTRLREAVPEAAMVIGGYHSTVLPVWTLENMPQFDYGMQGECDHSVVELAEMIGGSRRPADVKGLIWRDPNGVVRANERDWIPDLNSLPVTDRAFLDRYYRQGMYTYLTEPRSLDMMITSRGCPFDCSFCFKVERAYRFRSVDSVMAEFDVLKSRGVRAIHVMDDAFTANKKRCFAIADALIEGKYGFRLKLRSRVNVVDEELLRKLKACGVRQIVYGIESGSQRVLDSMNKRTTVELNERAIKLTNKVGIFCTADIMIGMPAETPETLEETRQFLKRNRLMIASIPFLYPLPGTKVYADMKASGQLQGDWTLDGTVPWVKLGWTDSVADLCRASQALARVVHRDPRAIAYLLRHNPMMLGPRSLWQRRRELAHWVFS